MVFQKSVRSLELSLDDPSRSWKPKEYISGEVTLILKKDLTDICIKLALLCRVKVKNNNGMPYPQVRSKKKRVENMVEKSTFLYGMDNDRNNNNNNITQDSIDNSTSTITSRSRKNSKIVNGLSKGEHRFPFRIKIPSGRKVYSSLRFERGSISYCLCTTLHPVSYNSDQILTPGDPGLADERHFSVVVPLDVSNLSKQKKRTMILHSSPPGSSSSSNENSTLMSEELPTASSIDSPISNSSKVIRLSVTLPHSGFVTGEVIPVSVQLHHYKEFYNSTGIITTLVRICRVGDGSLNDKRIETFRKDICQTISPLCIDSQSLKCNLTAYLQIPDDIFSTITTISNFFSFQYYVEVLCNLSTRNAIYTSSGRILNESNDTLSKLQNSPKHNSGSDKLHKKVLKFVNFSGMKNDVPIQESTNSAREMVNVETLKRLQNVTGMSIETVIGTIRSDTSSDQMQEQEQLQESEPEGTTRSSASPEYPLLHIPTELSIPERIDSADEYEQAHPIVPLYTRSSTPPPTEDKQELEQLRLQELESEPILSDDAS